MIWTRANGGNPVLQAASMFDETCVCEPCVLHDDRFRMWFRAGWETTRICYSESQDGITWSTPVTVLGQGASNETGNAQQPSVAKFADVYWMYYTAGTNWGYRVAVSPDGIHWTNLAGSMPLPSGKTFFGNRYVWFSGAGTWFCLQEAGPTPWEMYLYTSGDGAGWALASGPLTSLRIVPGGAVGGPWMPIPQKVNGLYRLWYHAAPVAGSLPTDIYRATSPDLINWTRTGMELQHAGNWEFDQVADPHPLEVNGQSYLFYDGDNNTTAVCSIGMATSPGPLV